MGPQPGGFGGPNPGPPGINGLLPGISNLRGVNQQLGADPGAGGGTGLVAAATAFAVGVAGYLLANNEGPGEDHGDEDMAGQLELGFGDDNDGYGGGPPPPPPGGGGGMIGNAVQLVQEYIPTVDTVGTVAADMAVLEMRRQYPGHMLAFDAAVDIFRNSIGALSVPPAIQVGEGEDHWSDPFFVLDEEGFGNMIDPRLPRPNPMLDERTDRYVAPEVRNTNNTSYEEGGDHWQMIPDGEGGSSLRYFRDPPVHIKREHVENAAEYFAGEPPEDEFGDFGSRLDSKDEEMLVEAEINYLKRLREQPQPETLGPLSKFTKYTTGDPFAISAPEADLLNRAAGQAYFKLRRNKKKERQYKYTEKIVDEQANTKIFQERYQTVIDDFYDKKRKRDEFETFDVEDSLRPVQWRMSGQDAIEHSEYPSDLYPAEIIGNYAIPGLTQGEALSQYRVAKYEFDVAEARMRYRVDVEGPGEDRGDYKTYRNTVRGKNKIKKFGNRPHEMKPVLTEEEWLSQRKQAKKREYADAFTVDEDDEFDINKSQRLPDLLDEYVDLGDFAWDDLAGLDGGLR